MKLEKFDYKMGNKRTKNEFIILGVLCSVLVITIILYKTFANFTANTSFDIISGKVADFSNHRTAVVSVDIGKTENDHVTATIYDDHALAIEGEGEMKDFTTNDLIGELLDKFISEKVTFTEDEQTFIQANQDFMKAMFNYAGRSFMARDNAKLDAAIAAHYTTEVENQEPQVDQNSIDTAKSLMTKVQNAGFTIETIEIADEVKSLGSNTFCLMCVLSEDNQALYTEVYDHKDYNNHQNVKYSFNMLTLDASLDSVGINGTSDLLADNFIIKNTVTKIPNDLFAWFTTNDANYTLTIPNSVTSIGINAFYSYNGKAIALPSALTSIEEYAFAAFNGDDITIPETVTQVKEGAFRDFANNITMTACPTSKTFAPNATIKDVNNTICVFEG